MSARERGKHSDYPCYNVGVINTGDEKGRWTLRIPAIILGILILALNPVAGLASDAADTQKTDSKGITVDDLWRGLKKAEQNIEKEIPKIGPAVVDTFKKITKKDSEKQSSQGSEKQKN
jgi:hypothetical protein